jgi:CO/xanthine dehydrogenase Mo-binding subunit
MGRGEERNKYGVSVRLDTESHVTVLTSASSGRPFINDVWKKIVSSILGIDNSLIRFETCDTSLVPDSGPSCFSRNVAVISRLLERCCQTIQKKRFRNPLPIEVKRVYRLPPGYRWNEHTFSGKPFLSLSWGAAVIEVELDPLSLETLLKGIWIVADCGRLFSKVWARQTIAAETLRVLDLITASPNEPDNLSWQTSKIRMENISSLPLVSIDFIGNQAKTNPGGIGELAANLIPGAYNSAVSQATSCYIDTLPINPPSIYSVMEEP